MRVFDGKDLYDVRFERKHVAWVDGGWAQYSKSEAKSFKPYVKSIKSICTISKVLDSFGKGKGNYSFVSSGEAIRHSSDQGNRAVGFKVALANALFHMPTANSNVFWGVFLEKYGQKLGKTA